jgi:hypothetical protein
MVQWKDTNPILVIFAGFYICIINFAGRNSEATKGGAGDTIFHCLGGPAEGYKPHTGNFRRVYLYIINFAGRNSEATRGGAGNIIFHSLGGSVEK